jgi:hypothetical protein
MRIALVLICVAGCGRLGFDETGVVDDSSGPDAPVEVDPQEPEPDPAPGAGVVYSATIAECINPSAPDPIECASVNGANQLVVDGEDGMTNRPWEIYLRFDLDAQLAGKTVNRVRLVMTSTDDEKADGPDSGAVWRVGAFDRASLDTRAPTRNGMLAASHGRVEKDQVVTWELPNDLVAGGAPVHLGVLVESQTNGGVNYWKSTIAPPKLVVDFE